MGYNTIFTGKLEFTSEPTVAIIRRLKELEDEDARDHPEWEAGNVSYIDFHVTEEMDGLKWNDHTEKTYYAEEIINLIIRLMRVDFPDFGLKGELIAQGENYDDRWRLLIGDDGWAKRCDWPRVGQKVTCPHCEETFTLGEPE